MSRAALVVIDVQESFRQRPIWAYASQPDIVDQVNRLVDAARRRGDLVVWVLHAEPGSGGVFDPASGHVRPIEGLAPAAGEPTLVKTAHNAFTTTNLQQILTLAGIRELTVCGIRTEQCVETTTRVGCDLGYEMTFVTDATVTFPTPHRDLPADATLEQILADPRTLSTADMIARTEYALAGRFATVRTVAEVTAVPVGA
ncbi:isochorismatase family protein [Micromonospora sp. NPDC048930]|uniref:isochorismatase family protein n=1 Tax=Micromonospora sp. NPDC048930 TaxID=3364261 RepID=UPI00371D00EA